MREADRTEHEQQPAPTRRPAAVGPALLALVVLAALPAAALAVTPNQNALAEISHLLEHNRRVARAEARAERPANPGAEHAQRIKPAPARSLAAPSHALIALAPDLVERPDHGADRAALRALDALTRAGHAALPPPAR